jgi:hypothetical protein
MFAAIDSWLFFLLVGIAALLRWLATKATSSSKQAGSEDSPAARQEPMRQQPGSGEEQIRKFLEALGQPKTSKPPPPVVPRTNVPPRPVAPVRPPNPMVPIPPRAAAETRRKVIMPDLPESTPVAKAAEWLRKIKKASEQIESVPEGPSSPTIPTVTREPASRPRVPKPTVEAYAIASTETTPDKFRVDLQVLLASPSGLRNAIVLREIFGPPRSLRPLEDLPGTA